MIRTITAIAMVAAIVTPAVAAPVSITGQVLYRERFALPPNATLAIELIDLAIPQSPRVKVEAPTGAGQVPLSFTLTFEDRLIRPAHNYALNAEIRAGDLVLRNLEPYAVTPLAQVEPISILVNIIAQVPEVDPSTPAAELPLLNITWRATTLRGVPIPTQVSPTLLIGTDQRAGGSGGCNSWFSETRITADSFAIGNIGSTERACLGGPSEIERDYFAALREARGWRIDSDRLNLLDGSGQTLVQFSR